MDFNVWGWGSPMAWAVFLVAASASAVLLGWALRVVSSAVQNFVALDNKKR